MAATQEREAPAANKFTAKAQQHGVTLKPLHKDFGVLVMSWLRAHLVARPTLHLLMADCLTGGRSRFDSAPQCRAPAASVRPMEGALAAGVQSRLPGSWFPGKSATISAT